MIVTKKQEFIKNEIEVIYEEFYTSVNQIILLEKFLKSLVDFANGNSSNYDLIYDNEGYNDNNWKARLC